MSKPNPFFAEMTRRQRFYAFVGYGLLAAFLLTIGFAVAPKLHERFHADAGGPNHECAVTLIAVGKCEQGNVPVKVLVPRPPTLFFQAFSPQPDAVLALFLRAAVFEHAPPSFA